MKFYSHLIDLKEIIIELDSLELSNQEKNHLSDLVESNLHSRVLDAVFSQLSDDDKRVLVQYMNQGDKDKVWDLLKSRVESIEEKIKKAADELIMEMKEDLSKAKALKGSHRGG